jgi:CTP:molybdopterin cytidylyltransferase MocA
MRPQDLTILIPAAGLSRRMRGRDKLLEAIDGQPLLLRAVSTALATGARVVVTLPADKPGQTRRDVLAGCSVTLVEVAEATEGMAASLRKGAAVIGPDCPVMILLPDLPDIELADLSAMIAAFDDAPLAPVLRATTEEGAFGHPVILPARLIPALENLRGDEGARTVISSTPVQPFPLPGARALTDLDTPEAWAVWRTARRT